MSAFVKWWVSTTLTAAVLAFGMVVGFMEWQSSGIVGWMLRDREQATIRLTARVEEMSGKFDDVLGSISDLSDSVENLRRAGRVKASKRMTVTAYSPTMRETDGDPWINATNRGVRPGTIAVSRDLFAEGWVFGKYVYVEGVGVLRIEDLMHSRWRDRVDIFYVKTIDAKRFGKRELTVALLDLSTDN